MKIAYINPQPIPGDLPSTLQALQMVDGFAAAGHQVAVVTPAPEAHHSADALLARPPAGNLVFSPTPVLRKRWFFPFASHRLFYRHAEKWVRANPANVVYVRNLKLAEHLLRRHPKLPLYFETHELFAQSFVEAHPDSRQNRRKLRLLEAREQFVYSRARGLITLTQALLDDIHGRYGAVAPGIVAPDGVDLHAARAALAVPPSPNPRPVLLYLGSLHRWKGVETAIDALPQVPDCELWIAGGEPGRIAELANRPTARAAADRLRFLGKVPPGERFHLIARADICLLPLINSSIGARYTSPLKLFEYMAMGKPLVASDLAAIREVIQHGRNGWLVEPEQPEALAHGIRTLLADGALRDSLGRTAQADASGYSWQSRAEKIGDFLASDAQLIAPQHA